MARRPKTTTASPDPLAELRKNIENLDSIEQALGVGAKAAVEAPPSMPPPLPPGKKKGSVKPPPLTGAVQPPPLREAALPPLESAPWRPADFLCPEMPPPLPDPGDNPFSEQPETRMPRAAAPEEKVDYFRGIVKAKSEALARAKSLYGARVEESQRLREVIDALNGQLCRIAPLQSLPKEIDALKEQLADAERRADRVDDVEGELEATAQRCVDLEQALETFEIKLLKLQGQLKAEKQATAAADEACEELRAEGEKKGARIAELEANVSAQEEELEAFERLKADYAAIEAKLAAIEAQMALREAMQKKLEGDLDALNDRLRQEKADYERSLAQQERSSAEALDAQEHQLDERRARELEAQHERYQSECRALQGQLDVANDQLRLSREEGEKLVVEKEEMRQKFLRKLSEQKKELMAHETEALAQAEAQRQTEVAELQASLDAAKKDAARRLNEQEARLKQAFADDLELERKQQHEREQTLSEQYENELKVVEESLARAQEGADKARADLDAARADLSKAEVEASQELARQERELTRQKEAALEEVEARHRTALAALQKRHREDLDMAFDAKAAVEASLKESRENQEKANAEVETYGAQCDALQAELDKARAEQATLAEALKAARSRAASLEVKVQQESQSSAEQGRALETMKAEVELLREKLETSRQASAALRQENRRLQQEATSQMQQARSQASQAEDSLSEIQEKAQQLEQKNGQLSRRVDLLLKELAEARHAAPSEEAAQALEREVSARKAAESRARDLEKALTLATQTLREAAKAGMLPQPKGR